MGLDRYPFHTSGVSLQPHTAPIRVASLSPLADCAWGVVMVGVMRAILTALLVGYFSLPLVGGEKEDFESIKADAEKGDARAPEEAHRLTCGNGYLTHSSGPPITFGSGPMNFKESPL